MKDKVPSANVGARRLLDRLLHDAETIVIDGRSYRMRDQADA